MFSLRNTFNRLLLNKIHYKSYENKSLINLNQRRNYYKDYCGLQKFVQTLDLDKFGEDLKDKTREIKDESDISPLNTKYFTKSTLKLLNTDFKCDEIFGQISDQSIPEIDVLKEVIACEICPKTLGLNYYLNGYFEQDIKKLSEQNKLNAFELDKPLYYLIRWGVFGSKDLFYVDDIDFKFNLASCIKPGVRLCNHGNAKTIGEISGATDVTYVSYNHPEEKLYLNVKTILSNDDYIESAINQFVGEFIGLMTEYERNESSEYHSLFCCIIRGLRFDFYRIQANDQYFRQLFANDEELKERLEFIRLTNCEGLDFKEPSDRLQIIKILAKIKSQVKHTPNDLRHKLRKLFSFGTTAQNTSKKVVRRVYSGVLYKFRP